MNHLVTIAVATSASLLLSACGASTGSTVAASTGSATIADTSATGAVAGAVGGALSNSSAYGSTFVDEAFVRSATGGGSISPSSYLICPTYASSASNGCAASGASLWLTYSACHFASSTSAISGYELLTMAPTSGSLTAACGTFPDPSSGASTGSLYRQYVSSSGSTTPGSITRTDDDGTIYTIDDATSNLGNFDADTLATIANNGYGAKVTFNVSGGRTGITIGHHLSATALEHSVYGSLTISEVNRNSTSRTISGQVTVYHDRLRVVGTSSFNNVLHSNTCCLPISGTITTTFAAGTSISPTVAGQLVVGRSESLQFTGCGSGILTGADGSVNSVSMIRCF